MGAAVAVMQLLEQVFGLAGKARDHNGFASEFIALERVMVMNHPVDQKLMKELRADVLTIEAREPPVKRYLDLICHNQVARSIGSDDLERLTWFQRTFAHYLNGDTALQ